MQIQRGKQSIRFEQNIYIKSSAAIVGKKEGEGPLAEWFDQIVEDPMFAAGTWEAAESKFVRETCILAMEKAELSPEDIRFIMGGDLLGQLIATSFGIKDFNIPFLGLYGACSNIALALISGSLMIGGGFAKHVLCEASSHFASAEKQFRFPLEYGNQRPQSSTYTVTGCGAFILADEKSEEKNNILIKGVTVGKIMDYNVKDAQNMGAAMAPAAADTIYQALSDHHMKVEDFDRIITGDLGKVGQKILKKLLKDNGINLDETHMDCGIEIFDDETQDTHSGGSGCGCSAVVCASYIVDKLRNEEWKRVLFVPTGALFSPISFNEGQPVPGIAHAIIIEREEQEA